MKQIIKTSDEIYLETGNNWKLYNEYKDEEALKKIKQTWLLLEG